MKHVSVYGLNGQLVDFSIDNVVDLEIECCGNGQVIFVARGSIRTLVDWFKELS